MPRSSKWRQEAPASAGIMGEAWPVKGSGRMCELELDLHLETFLQLLPSYLELLAVYFLHLGFHRLENKLVLVFFSSPSLKMSVFSLFQSSA